MQRLRLLQWNPAQGSEPAAGDGITASTSQAKAATRLGDELDVVTQQAVCITKRHVLPSANAAALTLEMNSMSSRSTSFTTMILALACGKMSQREQSAQSEQTGFLLNVLCRVQQSGLVVQGEVVGRATSCWSTSGA